jgi:hypothetical protein
VTEWIGLAGTAAPGALSTSSRGQDPVYLKSGAGRLGQPDWRATDKLQEAQQVAKAMD